MHSIGNLVYFSIPAANVSLAIEFYGKLFGWKFNRMTDTYWLTEDSIGSISFKREPISGTMPILYFNVSKIEDSLKLVAKLSGKIILAKTDAGDGKSFFATIRDRNENVIGLWSKD